MSGPFAVVLAAGRSTRFGSQKLLAPWRGAPLAAHAARAALAAPASQVRVVLGADAAAVAAALRAALPPDPRLRFLTADAYLDGMSASLKRGLEAPPADAAGAFVFLGDMPAVPEGLPAALWEAFRAAPDAVAAAPVHAGRRGHPALLGRTLFDAVAGLSGDLGAGRLLGALGPRLVSLPCADAAVLLDVDRPEDLAGAAERPA